MNEKNNLTTGNVGKKILFFVLPYLLSYFLQTFYGLADLFVVGLYNTSETTTAVSVGSQVMHLITVVVVGLAMGATVHIGRAVGAKDSRTVQRIIGTSIVFFAGIAAVLTAVMLLLRNQITAVMLTPKEAVSETTAYLTICFIGIPFITAYNVISSIFRGIGDSKCPMYFVGIACVVNIVLDFVFIGYFQMGASGAALGTVLGQAVSVGVSLFVMRKQDFGFRFTRKHIRIDKSVLGKMLGVGIPIAMQDGLIQIAFTVIMVIANKRGLVDSAAVGIVEKIIGFMFLVPSSFLSAISAITAQNMGAGLPDRARKALRYGIIITVSWGCLCWLYSQFLPQTIVGLFTNDSDVLTAGCVYLKAYSLDCMFAAIHFCFSGYFCGDQKSVISFIHNILSIILVRIPGAYLASKFYPDTLYPMGLAAPIGSVLSALICIGFYAYYRHRDKKKL